MTAATCMLAVLVIYLPFQGHFPTTLGVMGLNMFNILFAIALAVVILQPSARNRAQSSRPPLRNVLLAYYAVLTLALATALMRGSPHPVDDVIAWKNLVSYSLLYFLAYYAARSVAQVRFLLALVLVVFLAAALQAILQGLELGLGDFEDQQRAAGPFGETADNSNFAGIFYAIFSTFALGVALLGKQLALRYRVLAAAAYITGCVAIFATFSRQALLVIGITTLLLALRRNPLVATLAVAGMLAYPLWAPEGIVERIEMTQQTTVTGEEVLESSAASRYELWAGAAELIKRNPAGIGLNQFQHEVEPYLSEWIVARDAQNQYLRFGAEAGVQGLVVFLVLLMAFFRLGTRIRRLAEPMDAQALGAAFTMTAVAVMLGNLFSSTFAFGEIMANFWIMAGLLARYLVLAEAGEFSSSAAYRVSLDDMRNVYARWNIGAAPTGDETPESPERRVG